MALIDQAVSEKKIFENGGRQRTTTDGRTPGACLSEKKLYIAWACFRNEYFKSNCESIDEYEDPSR